MNRLRILLLFSAVLSSRLEASYVDINNCTHSVRMAWMNTRPEIIQDVRVSRRDLLAASAPLSPSTVVLVPDFHGSFKTLDRALQLFDHYSFDWFALEMLPPNYADSKGSIIPLSPVAQARQYIHDHWNHYYQPRNTEEALHFQSHPPLFRLVQKAQVKHVQIVGIFSDLSVPDHSSNVDPEILSWSNRISAQNIPTTGRGLIFMGGLHFLAPFSSNLQDYLLPERDVVMDWPGTNP